ncbi:MAG: hypothetical protein ACRDBP_15710, partial [Luteolibacter sp.]
FQGPDKRVVGRQGKFGTAVRVIHALSCSRDRSTSTGFSRISTTPASSGETTSVRSKSVMHA